MNPSKTIYFSLIFLMSFFLLPVFFISCTEPPKNIQPVASLKSMEDSAVAFNHQIVQSEMQEIDDYILRYHWDMNKTQTGLRYMVYRTGNGASPKQGDIVEIRYKVNLLNGDLVYKSDSITPLNFEIGKRRVVSGLEEGILLMKKGDRAKLIVPSHLAFSLLGDMAKIPARAVLVCDVELCSIDHSKK